MAKTVKVTYNSETLETTIVVDGKNFDTSRINGKEIAVWAYPFMMRKVRWNGFYEEMVQALDGQEAFDLVFEGSEEALAELKEAWENAPVNVVSDDEENIVIINYNAESLTTEITVNGQNFDTSRINGKEIEDWVCPFMMRKVKWDGIFEELKNVLETEIYKIQFSGTLEDMNVLMEECPETVKISYQTTDNCQKNSDAENILQKANELENQAYQLVEEGKYEEALQLRLKAGELGNAVALSNLGWHYEYGKGVEPDAQKAFSYYKKSAELGFDFAQRKTGICYEDGFGVEPDTTEALNWYLKAAEQGHAESQYAVGICYLNGLGVDENASEAVKWFRKSAEQGFDQAQKALGECYLNGYGDIEENMTEAFKWYEKAALQDDADSQFIMGVMYISDDSPVEPNSQTALEWFEKSLANGNDQNPQIYMRIIGCLKDIGFTRMDRTGDGYKKAAETYPEFKRIVEICNFAINNFECTNSENGVFYLELAIQYGFLEDWDNAVKYAQMATNFGVEGAENSLAGYKKARMANIGFGAAEKVADVFGMGAAFRFGEALGDNDSSENIIDKGINFFKSLF